MAPPFDPVDSSIREHVLAQEGYPNSAKTPIHLMTVGSAHAYVGEHVLGMHNAHIFLLLLRLSYAPSVGVQRDTLLEDFWPSQQLSRQRANLRQTLYKLRNLGVRIIARGELVSIDRTQIARNFSSDPCCDTFDDDSLRDLSSPFFLPDIDVENQSLQRWIEHTREQIQGRVRRALVESLRNLRSRADWRGATKVAQWVLLLDPLNEDAILTIAEHAALNGSKAEALALLDRFLADLGPGSSDIKLPATVLRRRIADSPRCRRSVSLVTDQIFVGRGDDLSELVTALRRTRLHEGSAVLLHGPPGIGKSSLVGELQKVAQLEGFRDLLIECRESTTNRELGALREVLPELLAAPGAMGCAGENLSMLQGLLAPSGCGVSNSDPEYAAVEADSTGRDITGAMSPGSKFARSIQVRRALVDLITCVSDERPLLLMVEDADWVDDASLEAFCAVIERINELRVFVVLTSRFASLREQRVPRLPPQLVPKLLRPLSRDALAELIASASPEDERGLPANAESWIIEGSEGNPLMLRALLEHWFATGTAQGVPPTLSTLIEQRIDRLRHHSQHALQVIGLLGRLATLERVKAALELPVHELLQALEQLELAGCVSTGRFSLVISHDLVRQVVTRRMSPLVEATIRSSIADMLESEYLRTRDYEVILEALVHTEQVGRPEVLLRYLLRYAEGLTKSDRPSSVLSALRVVHEAMPLSRNNRSLVRLQANQEARNGASGRALSLLQGDVCLADAPGALTEEEIDERLSYVEAAYRSSADVDASKLATFAMRIAVDQNASLGQRVRAADIGLLIASNTCQPAIAHACFSSVGDVDPETYEGRQTRSIRLAYHTVFGSLDAAVILADEILGHSQYLRPTAQRVMEFGRAGFVYRVAGATERAIRAFERAREMACDIDAPRLLEYPIWQLAQLSIESGDTSHALYWTVQLQQLGAQNADETANGYIHAHSCLMAILLREQREAENALCRLNDTIVGTRPVRTKAHSIALQLGVGLLDRHWLPSEDLLSDGIKAFELASAFCASDFLAAKLGEALLRSKRAADATHLLLPYVTGRRREASSPASHLRNVLGRLGAHVRRA